MVGGWLGARIGLNLTMQIGMAIQVGALAMLVLPDSWLSIPYVMTAQALSGIAKDLNKMSAKASVKTIVADGSESQLFRWVALLTGSKNALKGGGFFVGALLLELIGFQGAVATLAGLLLVVLLTTVIILPAGVGKMKSKPKFIHLFSRVSAINWLSAARLFLFCSRDVWFVVALPVFLYEVLGWSFMQVGSFLALWVVGYGLVQACVPMLLRKTYQSPSGKTATYWAFFLSLIPAGIAFCMQWGWPVDQVLIVGLVLFGVIFAINSAIHSYLILSYSDHDEVALNVGFYYMANAGGRLMGAVLSGGIYKEFGLVGCLLCSSGFLMVAAFLSSALPSADDL